MKKICENKNFKTSSTECFLETKFTIYQTTNQFKKSKNKILNISSFYLGKKAHDVGKEQTFNLFVY